MKTKKQTLEELNFGEKKFKRPVRCYICGKQMYYLGEKKFEPEYEIYSDTHHKGYVHQKCIRFLKKKGEKQK